jgi:hypothetical protein
MSRASEQGRTVLECEEFGGVSPPPSTPMGHKSQKWARRLPRHENISCRSAGRGDSELLRLIHRTQDEPLLAIAEVGVDAERAQRIHAEVAAMIRAPPNPSVNGHEHMRLRSP